MTSTTTSPTNAERAVWGLVDDRYDVAARTPSLSADDARRLCRVADMGDPAAPLDDAVAYLTTAEWGPVFARYYTNAQRDSSGRLTIVYDVVRPSRELLDAAHWNPFGIFAPQSPTRTINAHGELTAPTLAERGDEHARLTALMASLDEPHFADVLAGLLAGGPVLWLTSSKAVETIETIVLLLSPELRSRFTFQSHTLNKPSHLPLLTVAEQQVGSLREAQWSLVLPRDRGNIPQAARTAAVGLIGLGRDQVRLTRAHRAFARFGEHDAQPGLLPSIERLLRLDKFLDDRDRSDVGAALAAIADSSSGAERAALCAEAISAFEPREVSTAVAELVERSPAAGWTVIASLVPILEERGSDDPSATATLGGIVDRLAASWLVDDASVSNGRALLASFAAKLGQADAAVLLTPRDGVAMDASPGVARANAAPVNPQAPLLRFVKLALSPRPTIAAACELIQAGSQVSSTLSTRRASQRLSGLIFACTRRAVAASGLSCHSSELDALRTSLVSFWERCAPAGELDIAARKLFAVSAEGGNDASRAFAAALGHDATRVGIAESIGWVRLLLQAPTGVAGAAAFASASATPADLATHVGALARAALPADRSALLSSAWLSLLDLADARTRHDLLIEGLVDAIGRAATDGSVGLVCDACVSLGERGFRLDSETSPAVVAALVRMRSSASSSSAALRLRIACAAVEQIGDEQVADAIADSVWGSGNAGVVAGRLFLAAASLRAVERIRPAAPFAALADAASADLSWRSALPSEHARRITRFLRLGGGSSLATLLRRELPDEASSLSTR